MKNIIIFSVIGAVLLIVILLVMQQQKRSQEQFLMTVSQINTNSQTDVNACSKDWLCATTSVLSGLGGMFSIVK